jgi:Ankyrin repeats (3 copies)
MFKVFSKDEKILEAASDGDANKVERLISLGANINVRDRWGWTAMSMVAYGGHVEVARVLISHKAQLDNVDVDQETPLILARNRGHRTLVMMIEDETTRRATEEDWPTATKIRGRIRRNNVLGTWYGDRTLFVLLFVVVPSISR